ncbi:unnamed protein product, partial [Oppiella nova]
HHNTPPVIYRSESTQPTHQLSNDHTIVKLDFKGDVIGSDYINANFISGFNSDEEYIACQAPLHSTVNDFFRMIIEHNVRIVVTLTQCIEKGRLVTSKCEKYWPSSDDPDDDDMDRGDDSTGSNTRSSKKAIPSMQFGDIAIELVSEEAIESEFIIRELKLIKGDSHHSLTQYHFIQWPDFGCPQNPYSLIHLIEIIRKQYTAINSHENGINSPILVHCSAGVGRSGTFIAVDRIMEMLTKTPGADTSLPKDITIDVFNTVCDMRRCRPNMVQTEDQYIYIYDCIKYLIDRLEGQNLQNSQTDENTSHCDRDEKDKVDGCCLDESSVDPDHLTTGAHLTRQISNESCENTML